MKLRTRCAMEGCERSSHAQGYCSRHYQWLRRHGELPPIREVVAKPQGASCKICGRPVMDHGVTEFCELVRRAM